MSDLPDANNRYITTVQDGGVWAGTVNDLTDDFLSGFNMEVYVIPAIRLPVLASEYFLTKNPDGKTTTLSIRLPLATAPTAPTVHLSCPAA